MTTLLHEAYLDMAGRSGTEFPERARFMGYAARVMRALIIDYVRNRQAQKRGGQFELISLANGLIDSSADERELTQIGEALDKLAEVDPELAEVVDMKFFCGLSFVEIAAPEQVTGGSITTATDVYGLGVLLYVPLTGQHPAGPGQHSPAELLKAITETEPGRTS